ncbi:hypothetical protein KIN12_01325, partial [Vibrio cholerae]|nr:hypothetical protein [Vibrio cholerae]
IIMVNSRSDVGEGDQENSGSKESRDKNNEDIEIESHIVEEVKIRKLSIDKNEQDNIVQNETKAIEKYNDGNVAASKENYLEKPLEKPNDNNSK